MDTKEIILTAMESRLVQEFQTLRAAVTKYEMLAAIAKSKDEAWKRATTLKAERKSDAIWAEIEAAVLRVLTFLIIFFAYYESHYDERQQASCD